MPSKKQQMQWSETGAHLLLQPELRPSTARCGQHSRSGIQAWQTTIRIPLTSRRRHECHTIPHAPIGKNDNGRIKLQPLSSEGRQELPTTVTAAITMVVVVIVVDCSAEQNAPDHTCCDTGRCVVLSLLVLFAVSTVIDINAVAISGRSRPQAGRIATHLSVVRRLLRCLATRQRHQKHEHACGCHKLFFHDPSHSDNLHIA